VYVRTTRLIVAKRVTTLESQRQAKVSQTIPIIRISYVDRLMILLVLK